MRRVLPIVVLALAACQPDPSYVDTGPRLVSESTLSVNPTATSDVIAFAPTATPVIFQGSTAEGDNPLVIATAGSLEPSPVVPTEQPSKTPTEPPPPTATPSPTALPTAIPASPTFQVFPTRPISATFVPPARPNAAPQRVVCGDDVQWFFDSFTPTNCPDVQPIASRATFLRFENGVMIWVQSTDIIYAIYRDREYPRWQMFQDPYIEGAPETDPNWPTPPPYVGAHQPRRGFGETWRNFPQVRERIGWATDTLETIYSTTVQTADDGGVYVGGPYGAVYELQARGFDWVLWQNGVPNPGALPDELD